MYDTGKMECFIIWIQFFIYSMLIAKPDKFHEFLPCFICFHMSTRIIFLISRKHFFIFVLNKIDQIKKHHQCYFLISLYSSLLFEYFEYINEAKNSQLVTFW